MCVIVQGGSNYCRRKLLVPVAYVSPAHGVGPRAFLYEMGRFEMKSYLRTELDPKAAMTDIIMNQCVDMSVRIP